MLYKVGFLVWGWGFVFILLKPYRILGLFGGSVLCLVR